MMKSFMINCNEATFLMAKREEHRISLAERMKLLFHTSMCRFCRLFEKELKQIRRHAPDIRDNQVLPESVKQRMEQMIRDHKDHPEH